MQVNIESPMGAKLNKIEFNTDYSLLVNQDKDKTFIEHPIKTIVSLFYEDNIQEDYEGWNMFGNPTYDELKYALQDIEEDEKSNIKRFYLLDREFLLKTITFNPNLTQEKEDGNG